MAILHVPVDPIVRRPTLVRKVIEKLSLALIFTRMLLQLIVTIGEAAICPFCSPSLRMRLVSQNARGFCWALGLEVRIHDLAPPRTSPRAQLVMSNHYMAIDYWVVARCFPVKCVTFAQVKSVPIFGFIATRFGNLFVDNSRPNGVVEALPAITEALARGESVMIFPQGRWSGVGEPLPFAASLTQAAVDSGVEVQPIALRYSRKDGQASHAVAACFGRTLGDGIMLHAREGELIVDVTILPPIATAGKNRKEITKAAETVINRHLAGETSGP